MPTVGHTRAVDKSRLQALWNEGKASGEPKRVDFEELRQQARQDLEGLGATSMPDAY
jgi:Arc/MetJ-type ribon-helix-helix transcriptional regulator